PLTCRSDTAGFRLEFVLARHAPRDILAESHVVAAGLLVSTDGAVQALKKQDCKHASPDMPFRRNFRGSEIRQNFSLAYGPEWRVHDGTDCFDFSQTTHRLHRFLSLFDSKAHLTDSVAFLRKLHYRTFKSRLPAVRTMNLLCDVFKKDFLVKTDDWLDRDADFQELWKSLNPWQVQAIAPILDTVRHIMDATPHDLNPLARPGVILWRLPYSFCRDGRFPRWIEALDSLFPNIQFVIVLPADFLGIFSRELMKRELTVPCAVNGTKERKFLHLGRMRSDTILLVDVDGRIPNVALMKLSAFYRREGYRTQLVRGDRWDVDAAEQVYASCVFNCASSLRRVRKLREIFGDDLKIGGSGLDLKLRLPAEIEELPADFSLYSEIGDRAIGFLTRGCPFKCPFCVVPQKEGMPRQVSGFDELLQNRTKVVLLDDNILAHPQADDFLSEMAARNLEVNFNQTLDLRLVNKERAGLLRRINCRNYRFSRSNYHFSLNNTDHFEVMRRNYGYFGFQNRIDNVEFVCMYGFDTTLAQDVERFRFLRSLPGAYVFVQQYRPIPNGKEGKLLDFFDDQADDRIDQLIKICFPQNMKSMEQYYRWLSRLYFERFGKLHMPLVDTIFRYNLRDRKGMYIASMLNSRGS
ncbi:MAG: hypothetical protein Q8P24_14755, partial [Desulfobacterales bacterium]|nr:hypothetical protein [Desulfobacterales bacterium]